MKTATVTWITYNNYGTALQGYALQQYLNQIGVENDIISDRYIISERYGEGSINTDKEESCIMQTESGIQKTMQRIRKYLFHPVLLVKMAKLYALSKREDAYWGSQQLHESFKRDFLKIVRGLDRKNMVSLNQKYDVFLCGSDQIWSVFPHNFDGYFYLDFAKKRKISYAASIGTEKIGQYHRERIAEWTADFDAISVREKQTAERLSLILGRNVEWVADPTLLHDREFWSVFSEKAPYPSKKYLLCYFLSDKPWYFEFAKKKAREMGLKVLLIPSSMTYTHRKECYLCSVGPREFVALFRHAQYVLTDSYHGSIFSMIFERDFLYLKRFSEDDPVCQNIRIDSLFGKVGLMDWIVDENNLGLIKSRSIPYDKITPILEEFRHSSREFLRKALQVK